MNIVVWARVSSREQSEGYSLDAQIRINRDKAEREGWNILREFVVAESARRGAERATFNEMYQWVKKNAKRLKIGAILAHKLDRICRNMRDAVRMQELEDTTGVKMAFVDNEFGPGAAGARRVARRQHGGVAAARNAAAQAHEALRAPGPGRRLRQPRAKPPDGRGPVAGVRVEAQGGGPARRRRPLRQPARHEVLVGRAEAPQVAAEPAARRGGGGRGARLHAARGADGH